MVTKILILLAVIYISVACSLQAQESDTTRTAVQDDLEAALEDLDVEDAEFNSESLSQYLQDLAANPVDINTAEIGLLLSIPGMTLNVAQQIIAYRRDVKPFEHLSELRKIKGIGPAYLEKFTPYIMIVNNDTGTRPSEGFRKWTKEGRVEIFSRYQQTIQPQEGYRRPPEEGGYLGGPMKYYQRFRYRSSHLSVNITQEKDPGEPIGGTTGLDFFSGHLALKNDGNLQQLVIGDYGLSFGQGLVLWNGGAFGKGREVTGSVYRNERGIYSYASAQETDFYRGAAGTFGNKFQVSAFYSKRKRSASVMEGDSVRYPRSDGFHRTLNERSVYHNLDQVLFGGRVRARIPIGFVGATAYQTTFSRPISSDDALYNRYDFRGKSTYTFGVDYHFLLGSGVLFGELARSENGGYGLITGIESPLGERAELAVAYRRYNRDFQSILGDGFGEASGAPANEEGIYLGLSHDLGDKIRLSAYFDQFRFPAPRFGTTQATQGYEWLGLISVKLNSKLQFYLQARSEKKENEFEELESFGRSIIKLGQSVRQSLRAHFEYWVNRRVRIRTRAELVQNRLVGHIQERGYLIYQDLRLVPSNNWKMDARVTVFDTDSYNARVYQFENDLLYVMSNELLYGQGQRFYLLLNTEPLPFIETWVKFGITIYEDQQTIGSGLNEIQGNRRSEVGIQVRFRF